LSAGAIREDILFLGIAASIKDYAKQVRATDPKIYYERVIQSYHEKQQRQLLEAEELLARNEFFHSALTGSLSDGIINQCEYDRYRIIYRREIKRLTHFIHKLKTSGQSDFEQFEMFVDWYCALQKYQSLAVLDKATVAHMIRQISIAAKGEYSIHFHFQIAKGEEIIGAKEP
jgi:hypothetical protein